MRSYFGSVQGAIILGAIIISFSILLSSGIIRIKGLSPSSKSASTSTAASPQATEPNKDKLVKLASGLGLDEGNFKSCLESDKYREEMDKDSADASAAGVQGTPGFIIGKSSGDGNIKGIRVGGAYPYDVFSAIIDALENNVPLAQIPDNVVNKTYPNASADEKAQIKAGLSADVTASLDDDPVLGEKNAPITIIEFSDYECPFCQRHYQQTLPSLKSNYIEKNKVKLVFRDYVAVPSHNPAATEEAFAANCARELGGDEAYFKVHDEIFAKTKANGQGL